MNDIRIKVLNRLLLLNKISVMSVFQWLIFVLQYRYFFFLFKKRSNVSNHFFSIKFYG